MRESEKTQVQVAAMRETYRPVAVRGAIVYFGITDMATVDPMYQYSLAYVRCKFSLAHTVCVSVRCVCA